VLQMKVGHASKPEVLTSPDQMHAAFERSAT
jgi:hypothetical protein